MNYSIGAFAKRMGVSADTLRYYEKEQLIRPERQQGRRVYTETDVNWVEFIMRLKETGMPIKRIAAYAKLRYRGKATVPERLAILRDHRRYVLAEKHKIEQNLARLDAKIKLYKAMLNR